MLSSKSVFTYIGVIYPASIAIAEIGCLIFCFNFLYKSEKATLSCILPGVI